MISGVRTNGVRDDFVKLKPRSIFIARPHD